MSTRKFGRVLLALLVVTACNACSPTGAPPASDGKITAPSMPEVADPGLQQRLHTLYAMVAEYARLSATKPASDEKSAQRLALLKQGIANLEKECRTNLRAAGQQQEAVKDFLRQCISATTGD